MSPVESLAGSLQQGFCVIPTCLPLLRLYLLATSEFEYLPITGSSQHRSGEAAEATTDVPIRESASVLALAPAGCVGEAPVPSELQRPHMGIGDNRATWPGTCAS